MASNCGGASNLVSGRGMHESLEHGNTFANSNMIHSSETEQETGETRPPPPLPPVSARKNVGQRVTSL